MKLKERVKYPPKGAYYELFNSQKLAGVNEVEIRNSNVAADT
jgi:hypothetical protein